MLVHQTGHAVNGLVKVTARFRKVWCPTNLLGQSGLKQQPWSDGGMKFGLKSSKYLQLQVLVVSTGEHDLFVKENPNLEPVSGNHRSAIVTRGRRLGPEGMRRFILSGPMQSCKRDGLYAYL